MKKPISKSKTPQHSTPPEKLTRYSNWHDALNAQALMYYPAKADWRKRLIYTMRCYFDDPETLELDQFCLDHKISPFTLRNWRKQYPDIEEAVNDIKVFLGVKRRMGVHTFKLKETSCYKDMHTLDPDWIAIDKYHSELKKLEQQVERAYNVTMLAPKDPKESK